MIEESLSEHCDLMVKPGGPLKAASSPADCPKDAAYIKSVGGGAMTIPGNIPFPLVFEGGDGDDKVTVVGGGKAGVLVRGGKGNGSLVIEDTSIWLASKLGPSGILLVVSAMITLTALVVIPWRALKPGQ